MVSDPCWRLTFQKGFRSLQNINEYKNLKHWFGYVLPSATVVGEKGNVFTGVYHSFCLGGGHAWRRVCVRQSGVCGKGGHAWWRRGMCGREHVWQEGVWWACMVVGGHAWQEQGASIAGDTATAADSTHPTGMHSCKE